MTTSLLAWEHRKLGSLLTLTSGQSPSGFKFGTSGIPYYKVEQLGRSTKYLSRASTPYFSTTVPQIPAGSVLIAKRGAAIGLNRVRLLTEPSFMDTNVMALTAKDGLAPEFLYYWLSHRGLWDIADVTSVPQINNKHIIPLEIPLPPVAEQERIVEALNDADQLIAVLEQKIGKKKGIKQGMTQELLTGRIRLPGHQGIRTDHRLHDLGVFLRGSGIKRDDVRAGGVPCIRYGELYTSFRNYTDTPISHVAPEVAQTALPLKRGDLLFAGSGETREEIGTCVAFLGERPTVAGGDIIVLRSTKFNPVYVGSLLNTQRMAEQRARLGQGDAVVHISSRALGSLTVTLPPRSEQDRIADMLMDADREIEALRLRLDKAKAVKHGMAQQLLTGRVRLPALEAVA